jgi:hypothetical protein
MIPEGAAGAVTAAHTSADAIEVEAAEWIAETDSDQEAVVDSGVGTVRDQLESVGVD